MEFNYKEFVGGHYDEYGKLQFDRMVSAGLQPDSSLLDIGCGSLRGGRHYIPYLSPDRYCGIEPAKWLVDEALEKEMDKLVIEEKAPLFDYNPDFKLTVFNRKFDFLLAQSIFSHTSQKQMDVCFAEAYQVMHEKSIFVATFNIGKKDYEGDTFVDPGKVSFRVETMDKLASKNGLKMVLKGWKHPRKQTWITLEKS